ncbi:TonB-dependent receptor plug domain-containing protein [Burkholderia plantarii]|uniref:TonB-dependent receptor plug domain-containing protein n=1 Tax=Burkholderia plantarii TaxID=41899 RepID=UPI0034E1A62F|nr:TonB-dependent receptor plug domain-containing protein [Burkholderia plantarii]
MADTQARTLSGVVTSEASARTPSTAGGFQETFRIRGFPGAAAGVARNGLHGMVSSSHMPVNLLEPVDGLQGPRALICGVGPSGSIGGAIDVEPKHADDKPLTRLTATCQSRAQFGVEADVGRRLGDEDQWGFASTARSRTAGPRSRMATRCRATARSASAVAAASRAGRSTSATSPRTPASSVRRPSPSTPVRPPPARGPAPTTSRASRRWPVSWSSHSRTCRYPATSPRASRRGRPRR